MADMSKEEKQALVEKAAPMLWRLEELIKEKGDDEMQRLIKALHDISTEIFTADGLEIPESGGGGK